MAALDDTFNPLALTRTDTIASAVSVSKGPSTSTGATKSSKVSQSYPRIDLEPLYFELKSLISHNWGIYSDSMSRFIRGELSAREFGDLCDAFIYATPQTEHAHNSLLLALICNTGKDLPEPGLAAWVSATTDKSAMAAASKPAASSDAGEQRLKAEVKALHPRDRRRLKAIATDKAEEEAAARKNPYEDYYNAGRIKAPETTASGPAGLKNWELEIKKRYLQPLFAESLEFPDSATLHARLNPICYEEGVASGCSLQVAEFAGIAAETYLKNTLTDIFNRTRSNGLQYEDTHGAGVYTAKYMRKFDRESELVKVGKLQRTRDTDLLPCEAEEAKARRPVGIMDLQLGARVGPTPWNAFPMVNVSINTSTIYDYEEWNHSARTEVNGHVEKSEGADADNDDYGWEGAGTKDRAGLNSVLADCLTVRV